MKILFIGCVKFSEKILTFLIQNKLYSDDGEGNVKINKKNNSIHYSHKRRKDYNYVELGYMILNKKCFTYFQEDKNESLTTILNKLPQAEKIDFVITKDKYITVIEIIAYLTI